MRIIKGTTALALLAVVAAACTGTGGGATSAPTAAATPAATPAASVAAPSAPAAESPSAEPSADACAPETLAVKTAGKLTIGADNPAYPPYFEPSDVATDPWEFGDPTNGKGFESATGFAIAEEMGFAKDAVTWVYTGFNNAIQPGPKDFDIYLTQVSYSPERAEAVDLSDGYYDLAQSLVVLAGSKFANATSIADLKDMALGAQVGTTSLKTITDVIAPNTEPKVYDTNDVAVKQLENGRIDGIVVDLPTASYIAFVEPGDGTIVGQFANSGGRRALQRRHGQGQPAHRVRECRDRAPCRCRNARRARDAVAP